MMAKRFRIRGSTFALRWAQFCALYLMASSSFTLIGAPLRQWLLAFGVFSWFFLLGSTVFLCLVGYPSAVRCELRDSHVEPLAVEVQV